MIDRMNDGKASFEPVADPMIRVLILGSLPGDRSIAEGQYYAHPRNRFWAVASAIAGHASVPCDYAARRKMLLDSGIGLWDVVRSAVRPGSLDSAIRSETSNDLDEFIDRHPCLQTIAFNGRKAEALYDKYFRRRAAIRYVCLPSTSPANAAVGLDRLIECWRVLML